MSNKFKAKKNRPDLPPPAPVKKRLWHYTETRELAKIIESGAITVTPMGGNPDRKEFPAVWLSANADFEQAARKPIRDRETGAVCLYATREQMFQAGFPPVRIEIITAEVRAYDWNTYKKISGMSEDAAAGLEKAGIEKGADPLEWYASMQPIPLIGGCKFPIEIWNGRQWVDIERARPESR